MNDFFPIKEVLTEVAGIEVESGHGVRGSLETKVTSIPLLVFAGTAPGPIVYIQALQHGLELNGSDVVRRLIQFLELTPLLRGTLILAPMANPLAARIHQQAFPYPDQPTQRELNDMNRRWFQGHQSSNQVDVMVDALWPVADLADILIDLHCHEYLFPNLLIADMNHEPSAKLAMSMGFDLIMANAGIKGQFGKEARETQNKAVVTVEMPPLRLVDHANTEYGFQKMLNSLQTLEMLPGIAELPDKTVVFENGVGRAERIVANREGFLVRYRKPGEFLKKGEKVAEIWCPERFEPVQIFEAPFDSYLNVLGRVPIVWGDPEQDFINVGEHVVTFREPSRILTPNA